MFDAEKFISKAKPLILKMSKKSKIVVKNLIKKAKDFKISRTKAKKIVNALDESKATRHWLRLGLLIVLAGLIAKKVAENYDERKTFKQNIMGLGSYIKRIKERIKNYGC